MAVVECLIRLFPRKRRKEFASRFFTDEFACEGFLMIKDKDFETVSDADKILLKILTVPVYVM